MKNKQHFGLYKRRKVLLVACVVFMTVLGISALVVQKLSSLNNVEAAGSSAINPPDQTKQTMNVLVVEINPHLKSISGQPKVSNYFYSEAASGDRARITIEETVADLQYSSGGYLDINTTWEYLDEFPTYNKTINLPDGSSAKRFNESSFLAAAGGQSGVDGYWNILNSNWAKQVSTGDFDYNYLINKLDLVNRRNRGEFDQVWVVYIDPSGAYETTMIGKSAYWINGTQVEANCDDFVVAGFNIERRDSQLHALGHSYEDIMQRVYGSRFNSYAEGAKNSVNISTKAQYMELNLWERFTLNDYVNAGTINGVGTVHHPFNAREDYDYSNTVAVDTTYQEWGGKISDMAGAFTNMNNAVWNSAPFNDGGPDLPNGRYYMRFWLQRFPRETGYTEDGYLKNWWKYLFSLRHIKSATALNPTINLNKNQEVNLGYQVTYDSGAKENKSLNKKYDNISISNSGVVEVKNGKLMTKGVGRSVITLYVEGKPLKFTVTVDKLEQAVSFAKSSISKNYGDAAFTNVATTTGDGAITYSSSNTNVATVNSEGRVSIVGVGNTTITATAAATDTYSKGTASYTLTVKSQQSDATSDDEGEQGDQNGQDDGREDGQDGGQDASQEGTKSEDGGDAAVDAAILPDTSSEANDSKTSGREGAMVVSSTKSPIETPNTGSATSSEEGNILMGCYVPVTVTGIVALSVYIRRRQKTHRKFD